MASRAPTGPSRKNARWHISAIKGLTAEGPSAANLFSVVWGLHFNRTAHLVQPGTDAHADAIGELIFHDVGRIPHPRCSTLLTWNVVVQEIGGQQGGPIGVIAGV